MSADATPPSDLTRETPAPGLQVWQPRRGYRFGVEVYALADFALSGAPVHRAVDLGSGSGIIALLLGATGVHVTAVERDPRWLTLLHRNVAGSVVAAAGSLAAGAPLRPPPVEVVEADVRTWTGGPYDVAVANPPWFDPTHGPVSPDPWRATSRTATHGTPEDFVAAGLRAAPRICMVGPRVPTLSAGIVVTRAARLGRLYLYELARSPSADPVPAPPWDLDAAYARWRARSSGT